MCADRAQTHAYVDCVTGWTGQALGTQSMWARKAAGCDIIEGGGGRGIRCKSGAVPPL